MKQGINPCSQLFNSDDLHSSIREILGEDLALKFIAEAHSTIKETKHASGDKST